MDTHTHTTTCRCVCAILQCLRYIMNYGGVCIVFGLFLIIIQDVVVFILFQFTTIRFMGALALL